MQNPKTGFEHSALEATQRIMVVCPSCGQKLQPPGALFCPWCGTAAPQWGGSLEEDHAALQALREADAAIDELLTHSENLKITIENGFFEQSNDWVEVATLVVPPAHVVRQATISGHWSDQGTGNQKGRVRLALLRGGALISEAAVPVLAPHGKGAFYPRARPARGCPGQRRGRGADHRRRRRRPRASSAGRDRGPGRLFYASGRGIPRAGRGWQV